jgi:fatty acid-binding protein DegV
MLGIIPFYVMESGRLVSIQKARNMRQLVDMLFEFISEFSEIGHIALLQGYPPYEQEIRSLRERITNAYPEAHLTEHHQGLSLISLLGTHSIGLVVMEEVEGVST